MNIGERIKLIRKELGLSQSEFGKKIGKGKVAISQIENGKAGLSKSNVKLICQGFNVNQLWLTEEKGEIFNNSEQVINNFAKHFKLSDTSKNIIERYVSMNSSKRELIDDFINVFFNIANEYKSKKTEE